MRSGDRGWLALGAGIAVFEVLGEETLSQAADRYMQHHPWLVRGVAFGLVVHVCNMIPDRYDPLHWLFLVKQRYR